MFVLTIDPFDVTLKQGCTTQISWRAKKNFVENLRAKTDKFLAVQRVFLPNKQAKSANFSALRAKLKAYAGHIWPAGRMLCMPALL